VAQVPRGSHDAVKARIGSSWELAPVQDKAGLRELPQAAAAGERQAVLDALNNLCSRRRSRRGAAAGHRGQALQEAELGRSPRQALHDAAAQVNQLLSPAGRTDRSRGAPRLRRTTRGPPRQLTMASFSSDRRTPVLDTASVRRIAALRRSQPCGDRRQPGNLGAVPGIAELSGVPVLLVPRRRLIADSMSPRATRERGRVLRLVRRRRRRAGPTRSTGSSRRKERGEPIAADELLPCRYTLEEASRPKSGGSSARRVRHMASGARPARRTARRLARRVRPAPQN